MRSRSGKRSAGLLFGILALALGGCGTFPGDLASRVRSSFLEIPSASSARPPASPSVPARADADRANLPPSGAAAVAAESRTETSAAPESSVGPLTAEAPKPGFVPVALEPLPAGQPYLLALTDPPQTRLEDMTAQRRGTAEPKADAEVAEYDPWEPWNEKVFTFNYKVDKYVLKPAAKGYNFVMPDLFQQMIGHAFDNIVVVPKLANNILQWNWKGFSVELGRFLINSTLGIGGLFDIAKQEFGLERTKADFGQTLGKWGVGPGPYLIVPFLPPLTVRDGIGYGVDLAMDPLSYVLPFIWDRLGMTLGNVVNDRSLNLDLFQGFEETTVDLYSAVRNGYLQRRHNLIHGAP